jgi:hypothetical protein
MTVGDVSGSVPVTAGFSSAVINQMTPLMSAVIEDAFKVTLSLNPADAVNLQQDLTGLNISTEVLKMEMKSEQAIVQMLQKSVDIRV